MGQVFGKTGEATGYLLGKDQFNSDLFGCPVWTVDDGTAAQTPIAATIMRTFLKQSPLTRGLPAEPCIKPA
jgi:hypothetical protein